MDRIGYYLGIGALACGLALGCREPPQRTRFAKSETLATGEIGGKNVIYSKDMIVDRKGEEISSSCRLEIGLDTIRDMDCDGKFEPEDWYHLKEGDQTYAPRDLNQEALDKINNYLKMGWENKLPQHVEPEVSPEVKAENSKKVLQGL